MRQKRKENVERVCVLDQAAASILLGNTAGHSRCSERQEFGGIYPPTSHLLLVVG